jgi:hypothetical protein
MSDEAKWCPWCGAVYQTEHCACSTPVLIEGYPLAEGLPPIEETRMREGRCPQCGEYGPFCPRTWVPVCPVHGPYGSIK